MKILVNYFADDLRTERLEFEIDPDLSLIAVTTLISDTVKHNVVLLPLIIPHNQVQSIGEYHEKIQGKTRQNHFNAIKLSALNQDEHAILTSLNLLTADPASMQLGHIENTDRFIRFISNVLPDDIQEALVVRLADKTTMFGGTFNDRITQAVREHTARSSVQLHPYPWLAAGASNVIVHENKLKELSVALVYNQRRDRRLTSDPLRQAGIPDFFKLPEGYMHPKPCKGGEAGISITSADDMDEAEELMLKGIPMEKAYETIKQRKNHSEAPHPSSSYDNGTKDCAMRESYEEVGLVISPEWVQYISQREENRLIPCITYVYLVKYKTEEIEPPVMRVDGIEIREGLWGKLRAFRFEADRTKAEGFHVASDYYDNDGNRHSIEVPMKYALMIAQAIRRFRDEDIQNVSQLDEAALFSSRENVEARARQILKNTRLNPTGKTLGNIMGALPESKLHYILIENLPGDTLQDKKENLTALSQLGYYADDYHKKVISLAGAFKRMQMDRPLTAENLEVIANQGPQIESSLLKSRARLFSLPKVSPHLVLKEKQDDQINSDLMLKSGSKN